jgi:hypothetical protein
VTWKKVKEREVVRKHRTYGGAKYSIVQQWFAANAIFSLNLSSRKESKVTRLVNIAYYSAS